MSIACTDEVCAPKPSMILTIHQCGMSQMTGSLRRPSAMCGDISSQPSSVMYPVGVITMVEPSGA
eukprot:1703577-Prymnesium_polylepis.1